MNRDSMVKKPASLSFFTSVALTPRSVSFSTSSNGLCEVGGARAGAGVG
jgi:hypothetical protein